MNNPTRFIDPDGMMPYDPGKHYKTPEAAAIAWGKDYNGKSIVSRREYGSVIYKGEGSTGKSYYSYNVAVDGEYHKTLSKDELERNWKDVPTGTEQKAVIHSHGEADPQNYDDENFSSDDKQYASNKGVDSYLATPSGDLNVLREDGTQETIAENYFDHDPNSPSQKKPKAPKIYFDRFRDSDNPFAHPDTDIKPTRDHANNIKNLMCIGCEILPWMKPFHDQVDDRNMITSN